MKQKYVLILILLALTSCHSDLYEEVDNINSRLNQFEANIKGSESDLKQLASDISQLQDDGKLNNSEFELLNNSIEMLEDKLYTLSSNLSSNQNLTNAELADIGIGISDLKEDISFLFTSDTHQRLSGFVEKGPFLSGSLLFFYEIDSLGAQTGRSFTASINDNYGSFDLNVKNLKGKMCQVIANGFYYNEVKNNNSLSQISLTGIIRIDSSEVINVNVLTHLERLRVQYLLNEGLDFNSAKSQAITEVLNIFGIENPGLKRAEKFGLIGDAIQNKILMAISVILQGYRSDSELTEMLTNISEDIRTDGILDNKSIGNSLLSHMFYIEESKVIEQIKSRYFGTFSEELLSALTLEYMEEFKTNTEYSVTEKLIYYPETKVGSTMPNVLHESYPSQTNLAESLINLSADIKDGVSLKIEILNSDGQMPDGISYNLGSKEKWTIETKEGGYLSGVFTNSAPGLNSIDLSFNMAPKGEYTVIIYGRGGVTETQRKIVIKN